MTNPHADTRRTLAMAVDALADPIASTSDRWQQQHLIDIKERLYTLWEIESDSFERWESYRLRLQAETRIAHHLDTDTLDTY